MNLSGSSVLAARDFFKIDDADVLVICDDFNLSLGTIRMRPSGSAGGQNGLADILARLASTAVPRLRVGIGPVPTGWKSADFVLGKFGKDQREEIGPILERAADAAEEWAAVGIQSAMNRYN
jgi:PTH1 family peptidyl-tRNA hydrolase